MFQLEENTSKVTTLGGFKIYARVLHMVFMNYWGQGDFANLNKIPHMTRLGYFISL